MIIIIIINILMAYAIVYGMAGQNTKNILKNLF